MESDDWDETAFIFHHRRRLFTRRLVELRKSPEAFRQTMDVVFSSAKWQNFYVNPDDVVLFSNTHAQHIEHARSVFTFLRDFFETLNPKTCVFFTSTINILRRVITLGCIKLALRTSEAKRDLNRI